MASPRTRLLRRIAGVALPVLLAAGLAGCGLDGGSVDKGDLAEGASLDGVELTVGGKEFTEQLVLCHITILALKSAGATTTEKCGISGSNTVRSALESGSIDVYWEYTGTAWISYLKETEPLTDPQRQYDAVVEADAEKNQIAWLDRASLNNTYAIAASKETADKLGTATLSDYAELAKSNPDAATLCVASEFVGRDDGLPGLQKAYGFSVPKDKLAELATGAIYNGIDKSDPCNFGEVFITDGRIEALGLTVLEDDKKFFPVYNPAPTLRTEVLDKNPDIAKVLNPIAAALDTATMQKLNAQVDVEGLTAEQVAEDWLKSKKFIG